MAREQVAYPELAAGAAAANIGTVSGTLAGTLPAPTLPDPLLLAGTQGRIRAGTGGIALINNAATAENLSIADAGGVTVQRGQLLLLGPTTLPAMSSGGYTDGALQIQAQGSGVPRIGFHQPGSTAVTLYKQAGTERLRAMGASSLDKQISLIEPNLIGTYVSTPTFSSTTTSTWLTTPISTGAVVNVSTTLLFAFTVNFNHSVTDAGIYVGIMVDGAPTLYVHNSHAGSGLWRVVSMTGAMTVAAGTHTYAVGLYNGVAGTMSIFTGGQSTLTITELRS